MIRIVNFLHDLCKSFQLHERNRQVFNSVANNMDQGIQVYGTAGEYRARTRITGDEIAVSADAAEVIQQGLDTLEGRGGLVTIEPGNYPLSTPLRLHHRARLVGFGRATRLEVGGEIGVLMQNLDGAELADLSVVPKPGSRPEIGINLEGCGDCQVTNVFAGGFSNYGIRLAGHSFLCTLRGCSVSGNEVSNIYLDTLAMSGRAGRFIPNTVNECTVYGGGKGIVVRRAAVANIIGCTVFQTRDTGFHVLAGSNSVLISGCRTFQVGRHAALIEDSDEINLNGNIFCWHIEDGVIVRNSHWGSITGNEIIDSGSYNNGAEDRTQVWEDFPKDLPPYCGMKLYGVRGCNISGNNIFNWGVCPPMKNGIFEDEASGKNNINANSINFFFEDAICSKAPDSRIEGNHNHRDRPHQDRAGLQHWFQTFRTELKERFVQDQLSPAPARELPFIPDQEDSFLLEKPSC
jgi:hypothetical protein